MTYGGKYCANDSPSCGDTTRKKLFNEFEFFELNQPPTLYSSVYYSYNCC